MKQDYRDILIQNLAIIIGGVITGLGVRLIVLEKGADEFTANSIFWVINFVFILLYLAFISFGISLIEIFKQIKNKFYNQNNVEKQEAEPNIIQTVSSTEKLEIPVEKSTDINVIRKIQQEKKTQQDDEKLQIALNYTKQKFALYVSEEDLKVLFDYIILYSEKQTFENIQLVKIKELTTLDLYHFGWNLWNHFKVGQQIEIASFLKHVFTESLRDVEIDTIKSHLKDDPKKGLITIQESLSD